MGNSASVDKVEIDPTLSEKKIAALLQPLYDANTAKFQRVVAHCVVDGRTTKPKFPPIDLSTVDRVPAEKEDAFRKTHVNLDKLSYDDPDAKARLKRVRDLQYNRWDWACDNLPTYVNMLRVSGHSDEAIQHMFDGTPLCFKSPEAYRELRVALRELSKKIAEEMEWTNVNFVMTGSSVPGFSQNPVKGFADTPSKITSRTKSDVDICVVADGVNRTMTGRLESGMSEPKRCFPTTCSATTQATRFGCKDLASVCKSVAEFTAVWEKKLAGGVQFTFCEDDNPTPPWEVHVDIDNA